MTEVTCGHFKDYKDLCKNYGHMDFGFGPANDNCCACGAYGGNVPEAP